MNRDPKNWDIRFRVSQHQHIQITSFADRLNLTTSEFLRDAAYIALHAAPDRTKWEILKHAALAKLAKDDL